MWRFMPVSFAFLGWAFYEMSGGADYRPAPNSIQARALIEDKHPVARPARPNVIRLSDTPRQAGISEAATTLEEAATGRAPIVLASARPSDPRFLVPTVVAQAPAPVARVSRVPDVSSAPEIAAVEDRRRVTASAVNLRGGPGTFYGFLGRLVRGDEVVVLRDPGDGWVRLRVAGTGRVGWVAARFPAVAN